MIAVEMWVSRGSRSPLGGDWSRISTVSGYTTRTPVSSADGPLFTSSKPTTSAMSIRELGERESGDARRVSEYLTSAASALRPLWKTRLSRSLNVHVRPSFEVDQLWAASGTTWSLS